MWGGLVILMILSITGLLIWSTFEIIVISEAGSPIIDKDISEYLDKIEKENLINGVDRGWNGRFFLKVNGYTHKHTHKYTDIPNIYETQFSLLFPYYIYEAGVIPVWSKSYTRIKNLFKENIENSLYQTNKRKKLGLD